jgi:hypothetical protein
MRYITIRESRSDWFRPRVQSGGGRSPFFQFGYELCRDHASEGLTVELGPDLGKWCPREFWPDIVTGFHEACREAEARGTRLCMAHIAVTAAKYHDVDTTPEAVRSRVGWFFHDLLRDRARPTAPIPPACLSSTVVALARGIRAESAFDRMPFLVDALLDAGHDNADHLDHLRTCRDHGPGCWVVDMILDTA